MEGFRLVGLGAQCTSRVVPLDIQITALTQPLTTSRLVHVPCDWDSVRVAPSHHDCCRCNGDGLRRPNPHGIVECRLLFCLQAFGFHGDVIRIKNHVRCVGRGASTNSIRMDAMERD